MSVAAHRISVAPPDAGDAAGPGGGAAAGARPLSAFRLPLTLAYAAAGVLLFGAAAAQASDATTLAGRAGFLVGHAHRCGVGDARLRHSEALIDELIAAYSIDDDDRDAAREEFVARLVASALAEQLNDPLPSCAAVRAELARLEQHRPAATHADNQGGGRMAGQNQSDEDPARKAATAKPAKAAAAKPATTRREELTPERRAALALKRAAQKERGRPPSI